MTDRTPRPASLLGNGDVILHGDGDGPAMAAEWLEGTLRAYRRDGLTPRPEVCFAAAVLALADDPGHMMRLPAVLAAAGPEVCVRVAALARSEPAGRSPDRRATRLSTRQAAEALGVTDRGIRWLIGSGRLRADRDPGTGRWRVDPASVELYAWWRRTRAEARHG